MPYYNNDKYRYNTLCLFWQIKTPPIAKWDYKLNTFFNSFLRLQKPLLV